MTSAAESDRETDMKRHAFSDCHPAVTFLWFVSVIALSVCVMHPICLTISVLVSFLYNAHLKGRKAVHFAAFRVLPLMLITAFVNPAFTHKGMTILTYLPSGNPLTLESILYGIAAAAMIGAALQWFSCYNEVMTSDKAVYLFGRIIPALSLVISMALRFVPRFSAQYKKVHEARQMLHPEEASGFINRMKSGVAVLSSMITWSLENAVETGDSMRGRGYGLPGRTAYSIYRFDARDCGLLLWILGSLGIMIAGRVLHLTDFRYYPFIQGKEATPLLVLYMIVYAALFVTPLVLDLMEERNFRRLREHT